MGLSRALARRVRTTAAAEDRLDKLAEVMLSYVRQGVAGVPPAEVLKIIGYGGMNRVVPPVMPPPDPRADPMTGCMPVSAEPGGEQGAGQGGAS